LDGKWTIEIWDAIGVEKIEIMKAEGLEPAACN
jgi:hypothetical protein